MLFLLFVYYLVQGAFIDANPIPSTYNRSLTENHCTDLEHCRTIWGIIWSCLTTVFLCTWVSVDPNVPCPKKRNPLLSFAEHRIPLFICALLVPEYVLTWAIRQRARAREIAIGEFELSVKFLSITIILNNSSLVRRWTITHGFFIIMGGFHLFEHDPEEMSNNDRGISQDDKPLHPLQVRDLVNCDLYESFIMPTEAEIEDKGKSDWFSKLLVLLQTTWFLMQCMARVREHLPITHLEIVTLAYAVMNFAIYIFWWYKPLNVNRPVRVFRKSEPAEALSRVTEPVSEARKLTWKEGLRTMAIFIGGGQDEGVDLHREDRVPIFWANSTKEGADDAGLAFSWVGVLFGVIHCLAWHFSFPTHTELLMWQISSIIMTVTVAYIPAAYGLIYASEKAGRGELDDTFEVLLSLSAGVVYIIARAITLVLTFTSLRDLPPGAYETVHWSTFIPHI